jgi:putative flavoprotein involved in K+ transport
MNEFPFLQYPEHYPEYLSKDQLGDWLEIYSRFLDLNVWTSTDFEGAEYHEAEGTWTASLRRADGTPRVLHPRHVILATGGIGGKPSIPQIPTLSQFAGEVLHSSAYTRASDVGTNKAIIIGAATSAHDIAEDLYKNGVDVTILQRGPVVVNDIETANLATAAYLDPETPTELVDVRYGIGLINPLREAWSKGYHEFARERDAELLNGLRAAGMVLGDGHNGQGWLDLFLRTGGGYYLNKGASEIIVAGGITVAQFNDVDHFVDSGVQMADGTIIEADVIILATGFQNRRVEVAEWFGVEVAEKVGDIARLDDEGEWANVWSQTGQRGLWFNGGGINQVRSGTPRLAMFVKADLEGVIPDSFRRPPRTSGTKARFDAGVLS